jgi:hypothetical protein
VDILDKYKGSDLLNPSFSNYNPPPTFVQSLEIILPQRVLTVQEVLPSADITTVVLTFSLHVCGFLAIVSATKVLDKTKVANNKEIETEGFILLISHPTLRNCSVLENTLSIAQRELSSLKVDGKWRMNEEKNSWRFFLGIFFEVF